MADESAIEIVRSRRRQRTYLRMVECRMLICIHFISGAPIEMSMCTIVLKKYRRNNGVAALSASTHFTPHEAVDSLYFEIKSYIELVRRFDSLCIT